MRDFGESAWANDEFAKNYLDKADIYIVERKKMFWFISSFFSHFFNREKDIYLLDLGCGDGILTEELLKINSAIAATLIDGNEGMLEKAKGRLQIKDNIPEDIIKRYKDPLSTNKPDTLGNQLKALEKAGFKDVDCYYKNGIFTVFGGKK
jgi:SAM-dependent methyltransferase